MLYFFNVVRSPCHALRDFLCPIGPCPDSPAYGIHLDLQRQLWDLEDNTKHFHQLLSTPNQCCDHKNNVKKDTKISENTTLTSFFKVVFILLCVLPWRFSDGLAHTYIKHIALLRVGDMDLLEYKGLGRLLNTLPKLWTLHGRVDK